MLSSFMQTLYIVFAVFLPAEKSNFLLICEFLTGKDSNVIDFLPVLCYNLVTLRADVSWPHVWGGVGICGYFDWR